MNSTAFIAAFVAGLAGSAHCFGMCGGLAGALGMRARHGGRSSLECSLRAVLYQLGRIGGYTVLGAVGGTLGHSAHAALRFAQFEPTLRVAAGVLTILIALRVLTRWNAFAPLERAAAKLWIRLRPLALRASGCDRWIESVATGLLWGLLPCGLIYSMLLMTLTMGSAFEGAALMLAFGMGTLPAMAASSIDLGAGWPKFGRQQWLRNATGVLLLTFGTWMIVAAELPLAHPGHFSVEHRH